VTTFGVQEKVKCVQRKLCILRFFIISFLDCDYMNENELDRTMVPVPMHKIGF
jgi:hypothetical protein